MQSISRGIVDQLVLTEHQGMDPDKKKKEQISRQRVRSANKGTSSFRGVSRFHLEQKSIHINREVLVPVKESLLRLGAKSSLDTDSSVASIYFDDSKEPPLLKEQMMKPLLTINVDVDGVKEYRIERSDEFSSSNSERVPRLFDLRNRRKKMAAQLKRGINWARPGSKRPSGGIPSVVRIKAPSPKGSDDGSDYWDNISALGSLSGNPEPPRRTDKGNHDDNASSDGTVYIEMASF